MSLTTTLTLSRAGRAFQFDAQKVHRTLAHACQGRHLWGQPDMHHIVVRHDKPINWVEELPGVLRQAVTAPTRVPITGEYIRWALIGNPTKSIRQPGEKRGKVIPLPPAEYADWVGRKLSPAINLMPFDTEHLPPAKGKKFSTRTLHHRVLFTGFGTVKNHNQLDQLLTDGIGRGKAYGCGLLLIGRPA